MKILAIFLAVLAIFLVASPASAQTIDGTIGAGEWDAYHLGTSVTGWSGGMSVDVYGYADATHLYAAYVADTSQTGWATTQALCIGSNLYFKTPTTISWPAPGYTIVGFFGDGYGRTDGSSWAWPDGYGNVNWVGRGIEFVAGHPCGWGTVTTPSYPAGPNANVVEFKIPLSQLIYAGDDGQILLNGQYWQYDWATSYFVALADSTAPLVDISSPSDSAVLSGLVDIVGTVTDDVELSHYNLSIYPGTTDLSDGNTHSGDRLNDSLWCTTPTSGTVSLSADFSGNLCTDWDTSQYDDGDYQIRLAARDAAGNRDTSDPYTGNTTSVHVIGITIDNIPDNKDACKNGGWEMFVNPSFKNQGDCVSYVQSNENAVGNRKNN